jgi:hypothetical protein
MGSPTLRIMHHESRIRFAFIVLLLILFAQVMTAATETSLTSDEGPQLTSGYSYLVTGDPHLIEYDGHPPLAKVINALPLLPVPDLGSPVNTSAWRSDDPYSLIWVTQQFFYPYRPLDRLVVAARVPVALWGVLLAALIYRWASDLFGPAAGLGALLLASFDPNLLAHAGLATNDLPTTAASFAALFTFWRFLRRPMARRGLLAGLALGLAQGTKLNALLLLPTQALLVLAYGVWGHEPNPKPQTPNPESRIPNCVLCIAHHVKRCALVWLVAGLTLWASYGFELRSLPGWAFPLPAGTHLLLWERVAKATGGGHPGFLMGEISADGWWHYFPVAFVIKTPLPTLLALLGALAAFVCGWRRHLVDELALGLFVILYTAATVFNRLNIGYRHLLPVLPLLYVFAARLFERAHWTVGPDAILPDNRWKRWAASGVVAILAIWLVVGTVAIWPFHLAFFNELIGGPDQGYRYLVDSNADWGQTLKALRNYLEREGLGPVRLSTFIEYETAIRGYGIEFSPLPPLHDAPGVLPARFNPPPGVYVISTTTLQGIFTTDPEMYDWFRHREPDARIGHVMFVYRIPEPVEPGGWVAQCLVPVAPLSPEAIAEGFGRDDVRRVYFDCTQSWLIPAGGQSPGWYVFFRDTARGDDAFVRTHLEPIQLSFEQTRSGTLPPFAIYTYPGGSTSEVASLTVTPTHPSSAPVQVGDLTFLGHTILDAPSSTQTEVWTFWKVESLPQGPLSLMLHLVGPGGAPVVVGDGLGVPVENWQVGDVIVQRHQLALLSDAPPGEYTPYTGAYWLDTLERWPVRSGGQPVGDSLALPPLPVK